MGEGAHEQPDTAEAALSEARAEVERLRARTHEIQAEESKERAGLQSRVDSHRVAMERARESVAEFRADWTTDPPAKERGSLWRYTSVNTRRAMTFLSARELEARAENARLKAHNARLRQEIHEATVTLDRAIASGRAALAHRDKEKDG